MKSSARISTALTGALLCGSLSAGAQTLLVNMVPNSRSGETNQDAEPTITVDPHNNFRRVAGSAFTSDNLTQAANATDQAPIYISVDGGKNWSLAFIVPSKMGAAFPTGDITLSFSSKVSGKGKSATSWLHGGILSSTTPSRPTVVLRTPDAFDPALLMDAVDTRSGNVDQPHTTSKTSSARDKVYVGFNNGWGCIAPSGRSSTVDVSQDGTAAVPTFGLDVIEARNTACQDGFAQVVAAHRDGTIYAAFIHDWSSTPRLVVVRDDNWANNATPFTNLQDPSDATAGRFVTAGLTFGFGTIGQNRLGASNVSIAVDPNNSDRVYVAWGDGGLNTGTIHLRRSTNRGVDWSTDLVTVTGAVNPEVAINNLGIVGLLYQAVASGKWETHFVRSTDLDATTFDTPGTLLASQSATSPVATFWPYIGDYASLAAAGRNFIGMFSASNYPDKANFLLGVKYLREVDWTTHRLFTDASHTVEVPVSIDPFFFSIPTTVCDRSRIFCRICEGRPNCYAIYDPWWWLKCPMCGVTILVNPGDEFTRVTVFDSRGNRVGALKRLPRPIVENGITYTHSITVKPQKDVGYVLRAESTSTNRTAEFQPEYLVRVQKATGTQ